MINLYMPYVDAANVELYEYDGYGKKMYETVTTDLYKMAGDYEKNKDYIDSTIDSVKDYANFLYDEAVRVGESNSYREVLTSIGSASLTAIEHFRRKFSDYGHANESIPVDNLNLPRSNFYLSPSVDGNDYVINKDYYFVIKGRKYDGTVSMYASGAGGKQSGSNHYYYYSTNIYVSNESVGGRYTESAFAHTLGVFTDKAREKNVTAILNLMNILGINYYFERKSDNKKINIGYQGFNNDYQRIYDKIYEEDFTNYELPILYPYLVCEGNTITLDYVNANFSYKGKAVDVQKNGPTIYEGAECDLEWTPTKEVTPPVDNGGIDDGGNDYECDGVLCFLSEIVGAISDLVTTLLDGLESLFVPDDLSFITQDFEKMKTKILGKVEIITQLQDIMTGIFDTETSPALTATIEMPAMDKPVKLLDLEIIEIGLPIFKKVMSGVLILFTLFYVYRKITGDGGLMEK